MEGKVNLKPPESSILCSFKSLLGYCSVAIKCIFQHCSVGTSVVSDTVQLIMLGCTGPRHPSNRLNATARHDEILILFAAGRK